MKLVVALLLPATVVAIEASMGFCSYPMWSIPTVGTDRRCDHEEGCPKRIDEAASPACVDSFGVMDGDICMVRCNGDHDGTEILEEWKCSEADKETWELVGEALTCEEKIKQHVKEKKRSKNLRA